MSRPLEVVGGTMWYYMVLHNVQPFYPNDQVKRCKWSICQIMSTCSHPPKLPLRLRCPIIRLGRLWRNVLRNTWTSTTAWCSQSARINSNSLTMSYNVQIESCWFVCLFVLQCVHCLGMFWLPCTSRTGTYPLFDFMMYVCRATPHWSHCLRGQHIANATGDVFGCLRALCAYLPRPRIILDRFRLVQQCYLRSCPIGSCWISRARVASTLHFTECNIFIIYIRKCFFKSFCMHNRLNELRSCVESAKWERPFAWGPHLRSVTIVTCDRTDLNHLKSHTSHKVGLVSCWCLQLLRCVYVWSPGSLMDTKGSIFSLFQPLAIHAQLWGWWKWTSELDAFVNAHEWASARFGWNAFEKNVRAVTDCEWTVKWCHLH